MFQIKLVAFFILLFFSIILYFIWDDLFVDLKNDKRRKIIVFGILILLCYLLARDLILNPEKISKPLPIQILEEKVLK